MNTKVLLIVGVIALIMVGTALFLKGGGKRLPTTPDSAGFVIGVNAIYVAEPAPSPTLSVAVVRLAQSGFVVVHEDVSGAPGGILGRSDLLAAGETQNLAPIPLSRRTRDGETLYAMLHLDDGDGAFDAVKDKPALDPVGALPVMMIVSVSAAAIEPGVVSW